MAKINFPKTIHVSVDPNWKGVPSFNAHTHVEDGIDDDGPTDVADYRLVRVRKLRKEVVEVK